MDGSTAAADAASDAAGAASSAAGGMQIFVETHTGRLVATLNVDASHTIDNVRAKIASKAEIDKNSISLFLERFAVELVQT